MHSLRVGLIGYALDRRQTGVVRYSQELLSAVQALPTEVTLVLLVAGHTRSSASTRRLRHVALPACSRLPGLVTVGNFLVPIMARREHLDLVHDPTGVAPFLWGAGRARTVVTVHDVFAWSCPGTSTLLDTVIYRFWLPHVLPGVGAVITDSRTSKADIVRYLGVPEEKVAVVYLAVDSRFHPLPAGRTAAVAQRYGLPEQYILFVGSGQRRKNLARLLQACATLWRSGEHRPLVVAGAGASECTHLTKPLAPLDGQVIFLGRVPDADLPALYSAATLLVFPSLYEGFGLPALEAMACGTPVVCSNTSSLPEVVGDAALMVDPHDVQALAEAIRRALADPALRQELRARGLDRAQQFSWQLTAKDTIDVYREVLQLSRR